MNVRMMLELLGSAALRPRALTRQQPSPGKRLKPPQPRLHGLHRRGSCDRRALGEGQGATLGQLVPSEACVTDLLAD